MTIFEPDTDRYLERIGTPDAAHDQNDWNDVVRRARRKRRRTQLSRIALLGSAVAVALATLAGSVTIGGLGGRSIVEKAQAAVLTPIRPAEGTIEHVLVEYRTDSGRPFIEYETWIAPNGAWCRRTVEGVPGQPVADTRLTECRSSDGVVEIFLPSSNEILRAEPGTATAPRVSKVPVPVESGNDDGALVVRIGEDEEIVVVQDGKVLSAAEVNLLSERERRGIKVAVSRAAAAVPEAVDPGPKPDWLTEDIVDAFRRDAVREAGTMQLDGRIYTKLVTADGLNTVLVDPETGEGVAWIPSPNAFGVPTTVVRERRTLSDDAKTRRNLSLTALHPSVAVREVSPAQLARVISAQFPRG
jgi:hypothetical protein